MYILLVKLKNRKTQETERTLGCWWRAALLTCGCTWATCPPYLAGGLAIGACRPTWPATPGHQSAALQSGAREQKEMWQNYQFHLILGSQHV